jgi:hypothetical protein
MTGRSGGWAGRMAPCVLEVLTRVLYITEGVKSNHRQNIIVTASVMISPSVRQRGMGGEALDMIWAARCF